MPPQSRDPAGGTSRRAFVRSVAWTTPVIVVAAAAPAFAASGELPARLKFNGTPALYGAQYTGSRPTRLETQLAVRNDYYAQFPDVSATLTTVTVRVSYPSSIVTNASPTFVTGTGWRYTRKAVVGSMRVFTFTYTGNLTPGGADSGPLTYRVTLADRFTGPVTLTANASAQNAFDDNATVSYTVPA